MSGDHFTALKNLPETASGRTIMLPGDRSVRREQDCIRLLWEGAEMDESPPLMTIERLSWEPGLKIPDTPYTKWMDYDIIKDSLCLRHRQKGDYY